PPVRDWLGMPDQPVQVPNDPFYRLRRVTGTAAAPGTPGAATPAPARGPRGSGTGGGGAARPPAGGAKRVRIAWRIALRARGAGRAGGRPRPGRDRAARPGRGRPGPRPPGPGGPGPGRGWRGTRPAPAPAPRRR